MELKREQIFASARLSGLKLDEQRSYVICKRLESVLEVLSALSNENLQGVEPAIRLVESGK